MNEFLGMICLPAIWVIAVLELALTVFSIVRFVKTKSIVTIVIAVLSLGLFYDAFVIGLGGFVDPSLAPFASRLRFVAHGVLIPLLFPISSLSLDLKKPWKYVVYGVTLALMIAGLMESIFTPLGVESIAGILRYAGIKEETPKWCSAITSVLNMGTVFPLIGVGIYLWIKQKNCFLTLSGIFMLFFSVIAMIIGAKEYMFFMSMFGEILMILFMILHTIKKEKRIL